MGLGRKCILNYEISRPWTCKHRGWWFWWPLCRWLFNPRNWWSWPMAFINRFYESICKAHQILTSIKYVMCFNCEIRIVAETMSNTFWHKRYASWRTLVCWRDLFAKNKIHTNAGTSPSTGNGIPFVIMTSEGTHERIKTLLSANDYYGMHPNQIQLFQQVNYKELILYAYLICPHLILLKN